MQELMTELQPYIVGILAILLTFLGTRLEALLNKYVEAKVSKEKQEQIRNIVEGVVNFVEQVTKEDLAIKGKEKFDLAKLKALEILHGKGLQITETELEMLIESFVLALKGGKNEEIPKID